MGVNWLDLDCGSGMPVNTSLGAQSLGGRIVEIGNSAHCPVTFSNGSPSTCRVDEWRANPQVTLGS